VEYGPKEVWRLIVTDATPVPSPLYSGERVRVA
jgi:hypothetical protein